MRTRILPRAKPRPGVLVALVCLLATGCGGPGVRCYGVLTKGGKPLQVGEKGKVVIAFVDAAGTDRQVAYCEPDGTFEVEGKLNGRMLPGTYHLHISQFDPYPAKDLLERKFSGENALVREVTGGRLVIDLDDPGPRAGGAGDVAKKGAPAKGDGPLSPGEKKAASIERQGKDGK